MDIEVRCIPKRNVLFFLVILACYKHPYSVFHLNIWCVLICLHIYMLGLSLTLFCVFLGALACGIIIPEADHVSSRVMLMALLCDDFWVWTYQLLSLSWPSLSCTNSYWQGPKIPRQGCVIQVRISVTIMAGQTDPELSLCLAGALVGMNVLTLFSLYISGSQSRQWMPEKQTWWRSMQWGDLEEVTFCGVSFLQWIFPIPIWASFNSVAGLTFKAF